MRSHPLGGHADDPRRRAHELPDDRLSAPDVAGRRQDGPQAENTTSGTTIQSAGGTRQSPDSDAQTPATASPPDAGAAADTPTMPTAMRCLIEAYPDHLCGGDSTQLRWCNGDTMAWDDGKTQASHQERLEHADLADQMSQRYKAGAEYDIPPPRDHDPGRLRHSPLFFAMYGDSRARVRATITTIRWLPGSVNRKLRVTTVNGVDRKLAQISREIEALPRRIRAYAESTSGPFYWRMIKGTERPSMHSFAIALDIGLDGNADTWRWNKPDADGNPVYKNRIPLEIVAIFEKHGFIWGGKWYHFDTPHFEYRPELLHPDCAGGTPGP